MVDLCRVVKWWSEDRTEKKPVYGQKYPVFECSAKSRDFTILIPDTLTIGYSGVRYSDCHCIGTEVNSHVCVKS